MANYQNIPNVPQQRPMQQPMPAPVPQQPMPALPQPAGNAPQQQPKRVGVGGFLKNYLKQSLQIFKHPMKLLPTVVISIIWIVIGYFSSVMELPSWAQVVSFVTFSEGGLFGGVIGAVGGIVGKVVMAVFINSLILPLFEKKPPFVGMAGGIKGMFTTFKTDAARGVAPLLSGVGVALLLYGFMNFSENGLNSMIGVVSAVMLVQSIGNQGGFLFGLLFSIAGSLTKGKVPRYMTITRLLTGMTLGFTLALGLIPLGFPWCLLGGIVFLTIGILLSLFINTKKSKTPPTAQELQGMGMAAPAAPAVPNVPQQPVRPGIPTPPQPPRR
ncbi:MAG: hypothetical protein IK120_02855 [Muribaculaceae bacterium]|nr:hypothetical protein [Muribaculaceae bacterium]